MQEYPYSHIVGVVCVCVCRLHNLRLQLGIGFVLRIAMGHLSIDFGGASNWQAISRPCVHPCGLRVEGERLCGAIFARMSGAPCGQRAG